MTISSFPTSVTEHLGCYVYLLIDPRSERPFYVGKGTGDRVFAHVREALEGDRVTLKLDTIRAIQAASLEVHIVIQRHGLSELEALLVEATLIDFLGLDDLANEVAGFGSRDLGAMTPQEVMARYEAPRITIVEPVILINVRKMYRRGMTNDELYEITRRSWKMSARRKAAKYALTVYNGVVRQVFSIDGWFKDPEAPDRWIFEGSIARNLSQYVGGDVSHYSSVGAQWPIRYLNCAGGGDT